MQDHAALEERFDSLEALLGEFIVHTRVSLNTLSREMISFKDEMRKEMKDFKDEMKNYKNENDRIHKKMNQDWGNLARKMGTVVEDIIAPAVRSAVLKYFDEEVVYMALNVRKKIKSLGLKGEFDVVAVGEHRVFLIEVKSTPREPYLDDFLENAKKFRKMFPEYADMPLTLILGAIRFEEDFIPLATKRNIYLLAYREWDYMDILNFEEISESGS